MIRMKNKTLRKLSITKPTKKKVKGQTILLKWSDCDLGADLAMMVTKTSLVPMTDCIIILDD